MRKYRTLKEPLTATELGFSKTASGERPGSTLILKKYMR